MKKNRIILLAVMLLISVLIIILCSRGCRHEWKDATCTEPKTCTKCGETEGEALGHDWQEANYTDPKTCRTCGKTEGKPLSANKATTNTNSNNENSGHVCVECGKSAAYTYKNPFSGETEYYCNTHYQEIIAIMSEFEGDVGKSNQSKHTCEECSREGTHEYMGFTGQTEYYCTEHYEQLLTLLEAFGLN